MGFCVGFCERFCVGLASGFFIFSCLLATVVGFDETGVFSFALAVLSVGFSTGLLRLGATAAVVVVPFPCTAPLPATTTPPLLLSSSPGFPADLPPRDLGTVVPPVLEPLGP